MISIALSELKIEIAEQYLENIAKGTHNRIKAVEEIHPTVKNKYSYAHKLWRETEFRLYLAERIQEIRREKYQTSELVEAAYKRSRETLGLEERTIVAFSSKACMFERITGIFPNAKEAKEYIEIFEKLERLNIDSEVAKAIFIEDEAKRKRDELVSKKKRDKDKTEIERHKAGLGIDNKAVLID